MKKPTSGTVLKKWADITKAYGSFLCIDTTYGIFKGFLTAIDYEHITLRLKSGEIVSIHCNDFYNLCLCKKGKK